MSFKHRPGLCQKTTDKARVLSQVPHLKTGKVYSSLKKSIKGHVSPNAIAMQVRSRIRLLLIQIIYTILGVFVFFLFLSMDVVSDRKISLRYFLSTWSYHKETRNTRQIKANYLCCLVANGLYYW